MAGPTTAQQHPNARSATDFLNEAQLAQVRAGKSSSDLASSLQGAIDALSNQGGGTLFLPAGTYRIDSALRMARYVDLVGSGAATILYAHGTSAIRFDFLSSFDNSRISNLHIIGTMATAFPAILQEGTLDDKAELGGVTIDNVLVENFGTGVRFRTVRNVLISNCHFQDVRSGIELIGKCLGVDLEAVKIVRGKGAPEGIGVLCNGFDYVRGAGNIRPECVRMRSLFVYGFPTAIALMGVVYALVDETVIQATEVGLRWSSVSGVLNVRGGYIEVAGAKAQIGALGDDQSKRLETKINIEGVSFIGVGNAPGTSIGVRLASERGAGQQDDVTISRCNFTGFTRADIAVYNSGDCNIEDNRCRSEAVASSIVIRGVPKGRPVFVDRNRCRRPIAHDPQDVEQGRLRLSE